MERPIYHALDGLFFQRLEDGWVRVELDGKSVRVAPGMWASAVAHVSRDGENHETWAAALERQRD